MTNEKLILILSDGSMNSTWVEHEIKRTRKRELTEGRQLFFPISVVDFNKIKEWELFYGDEGKDLAEEIREYFIPDFCNWKDHNKYQITFNRLLKDLRQD